MTSHLDPRADLVAPVFDHRAFHSRKKSTVSDYEPRRSSAYGLPPASYPKQKPCYDWIFSSSSNAHVAVDRSSFKTYTPFRSYVLAVADQRQVTVKGISTVELRIRRQAGSKDAHKVVLENVLHVPSWICNILSDVHFKPARDFEHSWSECGVSFQQCRDGNWKSWGYTENFRGLDKIVLAKHNQGRSPMLDDKDREVFSINVTWPQHQQDKHRMLIEEQERRIAEVEERKAKAEEAKKEHAESVRKAEEAKRELEDPAETSAKAQSTTTSKQSFDDVGKPNRKLPSAPVAREHTRRALSAIDPNLKTKHSFRSASLRVPGKSAFREALPWRKSVEE